MPTQTKTSFIVANNKAHISKKKYNKHINILMKINYFIHLFTGRVNWHFKKHVFAFEENDKGTIGMAYRTQIYAAWWWWHQYLYIYGLSLFINIFNFFPHTHIYIYIYSASIYTVQGKPLGMLEIWYALNHTKTCINVSWKIKTCMYK